jgi:hypothetical protein
MITIIYDPDMEPITILDLSYSTIRRLESGDHIRFIVPFKLLPFTEFSKKISKLEYKTIELYAKGFRASVNCPKKFFIICDDTINCAKLKPAFLNSQIENISAYEYGNFRKDYFQLQNCV